MAEITLKSKLSSPFTFSQSSLQGYHDCNRLFQLKFIQQLKWPSIESAPILENERRQLEGNQFHRLLQQYFIGIPQDKLSRMVKNSERENLKRWWNNFLISQPAFIPSNQVGQVFVEQTLSAPVGNHRLIAKYDMVSVMDGKARIFDWKTSSKRPRDAWMAGHFQTRVYISLLIKAGAMLNHFKPFSPEDVEMVYWYAEFPNEPTIIKYDSSRFEKEWDGLVNLIQEISARQSFPLTMDLRKCGYCNYRSFCDRGIAAEEGELNESNVEDNWVIDPDQIGEIEF